MIDQILGERYQITERIGQGGMAVVYKAWDHRQQDYVAIKVLQPHAARDPQVVRRLLREARTMHDLVSSHIVRLLDLGQFEGRHYLVFEWVQGSTLRQRLEKEGPLPPLEALRIARQVLLALECAWQKRIVHRDISLNNIIQVPGGLIKVMDFGIAKNYAYTPITRPGQALGTAYYVSPEQAQGENVDARSDLYSVGAVLYHLLAGVPPFTADNIPAILHQHITVEPAPLRLRRPNLPPSLAKLVHRALEKSPSRRFQTPARMIRAVDTCWAELARRQRTPVPARRLSAAPWLGMILVGLGILLIIVVVVLLLQRPGGTEMLSLPTPLPTAMPR